MVDDSIIFPENLRCAALSVIHIDKPGINKLCSNRLVAEYPVRLRNKCKELLRLPEYR